MRNFKRLFFFVFLIIYGIGVCIGSTSLVLVDNQSEMYEYIESAMSGYEVSVTESVKSVLTDNMKLYFCLMVGGFFLVGPAVLGVVMAVKGYFSGFAITAVLRLFGIRGLLFCMANLVSAVIVVPSLCWFSCKSVENIKEMRYDRREFLKRFVLLSLVILVVLIIDGGIRGYLSAVFMKIGTKG